VRYLDSIRFVLAKKNWLMNTIMCIVCMIIPAIGGIVLIGYLFEVVDFLRREPNNKEYPDFKFDNFVAYLMRGIWPFIVQIITSFLIVIPIMLMVGLLMIAMLTRSEIVIFLAWALYLVGITMLSLAVATIVWPAAFYAGVSKELNFSGIVGFVKDFLKKVGKEQLLSVLFIMAAGLVLAPLGLIVCFVGTWFAAVVLTFAHYHLENQLYDLYLQRGGKPIPIKASEAPVQSGTQPPATVIQAERPAATGIQADPPKS
jgi:Protein of unknown function (DUF4013)